MPCVIAINITFVMVFILPDQVKIAAINNE